jgi:hypothetical protein
VLIESEIRSSLSELFVLSAIYPPNAYEIAIVGIYTKDWFAGVSKVILRRFPDDLQ